MNRIANCLAALTVLFLAACRDSVDNPRSAAVSGARPVHEHLPPHGGTAIVLGSEAFHLELVREKETGVLKMFVLDGHMEKFVRISQETIEVEIQADGFLTDTVFLAVATAATGETVGDTSLYETSADWVKTLDRFRGVISKIRIRENSFTNTVFSFPEGNE